jgi:hypothetical protein
MSTPDVPTILDALSARLREAAEGVRFVSESEAPFSAVLLRPGREAASPPLDAAAVRRRFDIPHGVPVAERALDAFFRYGIEDVDPACPRERAAVPAVRRLRETVRELAPDARAFRVGGGRMVRYLVVGHARAVPGALAGVETIGYES